MSSEQLRSLLQQARRERRVYENALTRADEGTGAMHALAAMEKWNRLLDEIDPLTSAPDVPPELKAEIKEFRDANDSTNAKALLLMKGQRAEVETLPKAAEKIRSENKWMVQAGRYTLDLVATITDDGGKKNLMEFAERWFSEKGFPQTEAQVTEYKAALAAEFTRWSAASDVPDNGSQP